jgi:hypothetical protein
MEIIIGSWALSSDKGVFNSRPISVEIDRRRREFQSIMITPLSNFYVSSINHVELSRINCVFESQKPRD